MGPAKIGSVRKVVATFKDENGVLKSPDVAVARVRKPNGTTTDYTAPHAIFEETAEGRYSLRLLLDQAGTWRGRIRGTSDDLELGVNASDTFAIVVEDDGLG